MSVGTKLLQAAAGNAGDPVYVDDVFSTFLHVGDSSSGRSINNGIDLDGEGGLVWIKGRDSAYNNVLYDTARGATQEMYSNNTDRSAANTNALTAFNSNGFTIGAAGEVNNNLNKYVSWTFRKQEKFFDIVTYTGNGTAGRTVSHNLGSVPGMIIVKRTDGLPTAGDWLVYHRSLSANTKSLFLNQEYAETSYGWLNNTDPTSTVVTLGDRTDVNASGGTYVMYLFAHNEADFGENSDEAIIHCGSLTLTSGNVTNVNVGFEPQWLLIKKYSGEQGWQLFDNMRGLVSAYDGDTHTSKALNPNTTAIESNLQGAPLATGFALDANNYGTGDYVYVAIARSHKPASEFAATDLFTLQAKSPGEGADTFISTGFNVDTVIYRSRATSATSLGDRLRGQSGGGDFLTNSTDAEGTNAGAFFLDDSNGVTVDYAGGHFNISPAATDKNYIRYFLRRAKGFYDVVAYAGTGSARTITHNLGVVPEFMIAKSRTESQPWVTYDAANGATKYARLESQNAVATYSGIWNDTAPTSSVFSTGGDAYINKSGHNYIIYLFATVAGISKVGSYTGTGSDLNVDCGFSAGARFVLIKRTDSTGDWYLYDSARGIVAGNDPYVFLNATDAEVTNTDYIDPLSSGFTITSSAPAGLNASSGTYIFLAIA